jgi:hypothetical protein
MYTLATHGGSQVEEEIDKIPDEAGAEVKNAYDI